MHLGYVACPAVCVALCGAALYAYLNLEIPLFIASDILCVVMGSCVCEGIFVKQLLPR